MILNIYYIIQHRKFNNNVEKMTEIRTSIKLLDGIITYITQQNKFLINLSYNIDMLRIYCATALEKFENKYNVNQTVNNISNHDGVLFSQVLIFLFIMIGIIFLYIIIFLKYINPPLVHLFLNKFYISVCILLVIIGSVYMMLYYFNYNTRINDISQFTLNSIDTTKQQIQEYNNKNTISQTLNTQDSILNQTKLTELLKIENNTLSEFIASLDLCNQYIFQRQQEFNQPAQDQDNIWYLIQSLNNDIKTQYNKVITEYDKIKKYLYIQNNTSELNTKVNTLINMKNELNSLTASTTIGNFSKDFISLYNIEVIQAARILFHYQYTHQQHSLALSGMPHILNNTHYITPIGKVIRSNINDNFNDTQLHSNDKIYLSRKKLNNNIALFNNTNEVLNAMLNNEYIVGSVEELIYANNKLVIDEENMIEYNSIKYKNINKTIHIYHHHQNNLRLKYDHIYDSLLLSYNDNNINKCIVFRRNDILIYPCKYVNYNLNEIETYIYNATTKKLHLNTERLNHQFNDHIWNLYSEDINSQTRIIYGYIPAGNNIECNFRLINSASLTINLNLENASHILFCELNNSFYLYTFNDNQSTCNIFFPESSNITKSNIKLNLFDTLSPTIGTSILTNENNASVNRNNIIRAFKDVESNNINNIDPPTRLFLSTITRKVME